MEKCTQGTLFFLFCIHIKSYEVTKLELRCYYSSTAQLNWKDEPLPYLNRYRKSYRTGSKCAPEKTI